MKFSKELLNKGIESLYGEYAWKKKDIFQAINELIENRYAILGGDVWAVLIENKSLNQLTRIDSNNIAVGIIKGKDGQDYVFNWHSEKKSNETWKDYVLRTKQETISSIEKMNTENTVSPKYKDSIYYNLVYANENEYKNLK